MTESSENFRADELSPEWEKRIQEAMGASWGEKGEWARRLGVLPTSLSGYLKGRQRPRVDFFIRLARETGTSLDWLLTGEGLKRRSTSGMRSELRRIPIVGRVPAGPPGGAAWAEYDAADIWDSLHDLPEEGILGLKVQGDSMFPTLFDDDLIIAAISDGHRWTSGELVVAEIEGASEDYTIKRLGPEDRERITLIPDNLLHYPVATYERDQVELRGHVLRVIRTPDRHGLGHLSDAELGLLEFYQCPQAQEIMELMPQLGAVARQVAMAQLREMARLKL